MAGLFLMQPVAGMQMASRSANRPASFRVNLRRLSLPRRRLREAKSIMTPAMVRVRAVIERERLALRPMPLVVPTRRDVVVKTTFCVTADVASATVAGGVQVTPTGAAPVDTQVSVTVPVNELLGVRTRAT